MRKKVERREVGEREKENRKCLFNERRERSVIYIYIYILFFFKLQCTSKDFSFSCAL